MPNYMIEVLYVMLLWFKSDAAQILFSSLDLFAYQFVWNSLNYRLAAPF